MTYKEDFEKVLAALGSIKPLSPLVTERLLAKAVQRSARMNDIISGLENVKKEVAELRHRLREGQ